MTKQRIAYPNNPFMAAAWLSALTVAASTPDMLVAYEANRGRKFILATLRTALDKMIDKVTGFEDSSVNDFVNWFNEMVWGEDPLAMNQKVEVTVDWSAMPQHKIEQALAEARAASKVAWDSDPNLDRYSVTLIGPSQEKATPR